MKKGIIFFPIIFLAVIIAGLYGIIHDQFTYTISNEYFTKFKFIQFGFIYPNEGQAIVVPNPRLVVALVGFFATWWVGLIIGTILALVGLIHRDHKRMFTVTMSSFMITIFVAILTGLLGLIYGYFFLTIDNVDWFVPNDVVNKHNFIMIGSMHNFSYLGGLIGLVLGIIYSVRKK